MAGQKTVAIPRNKRMCLNCEHFDAYYTKNRGNIALWLATNRGICRSREKEFDSTRRACPQFEMEKPK